MNYIEIKRVRRSIFKREIVCISSMVAPIDLSFEYERLKKLKITSGGKVLLETDGDKYIRYLFCNKYFRANKGGIKRTDLTSSSERIVFEWVEENPPVFQSHYCAAAFFGGTVYKLFETDRKSEEGARAEFNSDGEFLLHLGILAFYWTREESSRVITA